MQALLFDILSWNNGCERGSCCFNWGHGHQLLISIFAADLLLRHVDIKRRLSFNNPFFFLERKLTMLKTTSKDKQNGTMFENNLKKTQKIKRDYPDSAVTTGKYGAQEIDRKTALQKSQNEESNRILFTLTYHPQNLAVKIVIFKNFKILRNDPKTKHIFPRPPLISFKRDKNIGNFLVRSAFKSDNEPGTFKCARTRCKTCPFISNMVKISGSNRSVKITDHFT